VVELLGKLRWPVKKLALYEEALTHSSYAYESANLRSNERLEFLGDAVLELVISEYFFKVFPGYPEGKLTLMRHNIVNEKTLFQIAQGMELGSYIKFGKGEFLSGGSGKPSLLADALEALIGALFMDIGYDETKVWVLELFKPFLDAVEQGEIPLLDYKTMLQERCQSGQGILPEYQITAEYGPPHNKTFEALVKVDNKKIGYGRGKSKKEAEQSAAKCAYEFLERK
jgi:ribonuclease-3